MSYSFWRGLPDIPLTWIRNPEGVKSVTDTFTVKPSVCPSPSPPWGSGCSLSAGSRSLCIETQQRCLYRLVIKRKQVILSFGLRIAKFSIINNQFQRFFITKCCFSSPVMASFPCLFILYFFFYCYCTKWWAKKDIFGLWFLDINIKLLCVSGHLTSNNVKPANLRFRVSFSSCVFLLMLVVMDADVAFLVLGPVFVHMRCYYSCELN